ncbi:MAG TPA: hypothetical protein VGN64_18200 [Dyadobacter sp.]|nr:hypothetical protein [Dyadobacter sp.]
MKIAEPYRLKLPILQWLLLVFLSAGLVNSSFQYRSVKPFSFVENTLYGKSRNTRVALYTLTPSRVFLIKTINLQTRTLQFLSEKLQIRHGLAFHRNPSIQTLFLRFNIPSILPGRSTFASEPDFIFHS